MYVKKQVAKAVITDEDIIISLEESNYQKFISALEFAKSANKRNPSLYTRLELGNSWNDVAVKIIATCQL